MWYFTNLFVVVCLFCFGCGVIWFVLCGWCCVLFVITLFVAWFVCVFCLFSVYCLDCLFDCFSGCWLIVLIILWSLYAYCFSLILIGLVCFELVYCFVCFVCFVLFVI